ncbi:hypothetical protein EXIGLDRAFT_760653, partial [Exidia glandulosa HHB12029]
MQHPVVPASPSAAAAPKPPSALLTFTAVSCGPYWLCEDKFYSPAPSSQAWMSATNARQMTIDFVQLDLPHHRIREVTYEGNREYEMDPDVMYSFGIVSTALSNSCDSLYNERPYLPRIQHQWRDAIASAVSASYPRTMMVMQVFTWAMNWLDYVCQWLEFQHRLRRYNELGESPEPDVRTLLQSSAKSSYARSASLKSVPRSREGSNRGRSTTRVTPSSQRERSVSSSKHAEEIAKLKRSMETLQSKISSLSNVQPGSSAPAAVQETSSLPPQASSLPPQASAPGARPRRTTSAPPSTKLAADAGTRDLPPQMRQDALDFTRVRQTLQAESNTPARDTKGKGRPGPDVFAAAATPWKPPFQDEAEEEAVNEDLVTDDDLGIIQGILHGAPPALGGGSAPPAPIRSMPEHWRQTPAHLRRSTDPMIPASEYAARAQPPVGVASAVHDAFEQQAGALPAQVPRPRSGSRRNPGHVDIFPSLARLQRDPFAEDEEPEENDARRRPPPPPPPGPSDGSDDSYSSNHGGRGPPGGPYRRNSDP